MKGYNRSTNAFMNCGLYTIQAHSPCDVQNTLITMCVCVCVYIYHIIFNQLIFNKSTEDQNIEIKFLTHQT
jgi:hypothetical protein